MKTFFTSIIPYLLPKPTLFFWFFIPLALIEQLSYKKNSKSIFTTLRYGTLSILTCIILVMLFRTYIFASALGTGSVPYRSFFTVCFLFILYRFYNTYRPIPYPRFQSPPPSIFYLFCISNVIALAVLPKLRLFLIDFKNGEPYTLFCILATILAHLLVGFTLLYLSIRIMRETLRNVQHQSVTVLLAKLFLLNLVGYTIANIITHVLITLPFTDLSFYQCISYGEVIKSWLNRIILLLVSIHLLRTLPCYYRHSATPYLTAEPTPFQKRLSELAQAENTYYFDTGDVPLTQEELPEGAALHSLGESREGRPVQAIQIGEGACNVSILAGCHADEPIGPLTARQLPHILREHFPELLQSYRFHIIPQINPDGAHANAPWFSQPLQFELYAEKVQREQPGDDIEYGFEQSDEARPECLAALAFLRENGPYCAHFSLHNMPATEGAWFLIDAAHQNETALLRERLRTYADTMQIALHDIDRKGEKGFTRIEAGFCSTPTATAMRDYFIQRNKPETAACFRASSMEFIQSLGGNPLCIVPELPLFLLTRPSSTLEDPVLPKFQQALKQARGSEEPTPAIQKLIQEYGLIPLPLNLQVHMQLAVILLSLEFLNDTPSQKTQA